MPLNEDSLMFPIATFTHRRDKGERDGERRQREKAERREFCPTGKDINRTR